MNSIEANGASPYLGRPADRASASIAAQANHTGSEPHCLTLLGPEPPLPVFQQGWWLAIARGKNDLKVEQLTERGAILGRLSYMKSRNRLGFVLGDLPYWTHLSGPWLADGLGLGDKADVLNQLVAQLPGTTSFDLICHPRKEDAALIRQVFESFGFTVSTQNTYCQAPYTPHVMARISAEQRKNIVRAAKKLDVVSLDANEFITFYAENLGEWGRSSYAPLSLARDLIAEGLRRSPPQVKVFAASRKEAVAGLQRCPMDAAIACAWDDERYYYFMSTRKRVCREHPEWKPNADAVKLLLVHAMEHARTMGLIFDADGVTEPGTEILYRDILKIPQLEQRLVLRREFGMYTKYKTIKRKIETTCACVRTPAKPGK